MAVESTRYGKQYSSHAKFAYSAELFVAHFPGASATEIAHLIELGKTHKRLGIKSKFNEIYTSCESYETYCAIQADYNNLT